MALIVTMEIRPSRMPKDDPTWTFARATNPVIEGWIVRLISDDGTEGLGYASASPHLGTTFDTMKGVFDGIAESLIGQSPFDLDAILDELDARLANLNPIKAGIDCALHDLLARTRGVPLCDLFGGPVRSSVPILRTMAIKTPDEMAVQAQRLVDDGYGYLKIKVHGDVDEDVACVKAIREQVGRDIHLTIDANQSYAPKDAIAALNRMAAYDVELAEQPVSVSDLAGLKLVTDSVPILVEADEGASSVAAIGTLVADRIVDAVSLKIPQLGGLRNALAAARICAAGGVRCRLGGAVGPRLLTAQAMHLCAALPSVG